MFQAGRYHITELLHVEYAQLLNHLVIIPIVEAKVIVLIKR
jgi:hypothetical protein